MSLLDIGSNLVRKATNKRQNDAEALPPPANKEQESGIESRGDELEIESRETFRRVKMRIFT